METTTTITGIQATTGERKQRKDGAAGPSKQTRLVPNSERNVLKNKEGEQTVRQIDFCPKQLGIGWNENHRGTKRHRKETGRRGDAPGLEKHIDASIRIGFQGRFGPLIDGERGTARFGSLEERPH